MDSGVDAAGLAWSLGFLGYKADTETAKVGCVMAKTELMGCRKGCGGTGCKQAALCFLA